MKRLIFVFLMFAAACGSDSTNDTQNKPTVDPDSQFVEGKSDVLTNYYTTIVGELDTFDYVQAEVDYPDYFHGYTVSLEEGDTFRAELVTTADSIFRLYGPQRNSSVTRPRFGRAQVRAQTTYTDDVHRSIIEFEVERTGTYLVLTGPKYVWNAEYNLAVQLVREDECFEDTDCGSTEICADNGVRCVTSPCYANYDVCIPTVVEGCEDHDDCGDDAWCRATDWENDVKECVPFVGEGESCGGFAPPQYINACAPEYQCVYRPFIADAPGTCRTVVTVQELLDDPEKYDGQRVYIDGYVSAQLAFCTQLACSPENPCCNNCGAGMQVNDHQTRAYVPGVGLKDVDGNEYSCGGNECTYQDNCTTEQGKYQVVGTVEAGEFGVSVTVETLTSLDRF